MTYSKHYDLLIKKARSREKPNEYCERHHVIPKSLGGSNDASNLVWLTAREHFVAHRLLAHIHGKPMWFALWRMATSKRYGSRSYAKIREKVISSRSGVPLSSETRRKMSIVRKGKKPTAAAIAARRQGLMGHKVTEETRNKIRESLAAYSRPVIQLHNNEAVAEFPSVNEAERQTGIRRNNLRNALNGRSKSAGGFQWRYR